MNRKTGLDSEYYQYQAPFAGIIAKVAGYARQNMFNTLMKAARPTSDTLVLDIGVTSNRRQDSNFFEKLYPYPHHLTAVGLEDAQFLEHQHPGLRYIQADALNLPFPDKSFDLAVSFAVIEHIGSRERQQRFVRELQRVSRAYFITTPNRGFPLEFHTLTPFIHWLPPEQFRGLLKLLHRDFYACEETLNLLNEEDFLALLPPTAKVQKLHFRLLGLISNLVFYVEP